MESLTIVPDLERTGFKAMEGVDREDIIEIKTFEIGALAAGMSSGAPSIALAFRLPDGRAVFAETSMKLLLTAADTLKSLYGDPR